MSDQRDGDGSGRERVADGLETDLTPHDGETYKVLGELDAPEGTGVLGHNTATTGTAAGVQGVVDSSGTSASGVFGEATATSGDAFGVFGRTNSATATAAAVRAYASTGARGVYATANSGTAVYGFSVSDRGGTFETDTGSSGVFAKNNTTSTPNNHGVEGQTTSTGIYSAGVRGFARGGTGQTFGVSGETASADSGAAGVHGEAAAGSGATYGVHGVTKSSDPAAAGIRAEGTDTAPAVSASGHVEVSDVGVSAYLSSDQTVPDNTETTIVFDSVNRDDFDAYDEATGEFTVPADGDYRVEFAINWSDTFSGDFLTHNLQINSDPSGGFGLNFTASDQVSRSHSRTLFGLTSGDIVDVEVRHISGTSKDVAGNSSDIGTYLTITRVG